MKDVHRSYRYEIGTLDCSDGDIEVRYGQRNQKIGWVNIGPSRMT